MVIVGDQAPDFTAPLANGDIDSFTLSDQLDGVPLVLAFFPAAFSSICTSEVCAIQDSIVSLDSLDATVYGISVDVPFALNEFRDQNNLSFDMIGDVDKGMIDAYDVATTFAGFTIANRAVFVVDDNREIVYAEIPEDPSVEPDYEKLVSFLESF